MFKAVTNNLAIGSVADPTGLQEIAEEGFATVIDLCTEGEGNQLNKEIVENLSLKFVSIPVSGQNLNTDTLQKFKTAIETLPQPIYVRCASGLRAGVFSLLALADKQGWTHQEYLSRRKDLGLEHKPNCPLADFASSLLAE